MGEWVDPSNADLAGSLNLDFMPQQMSAQEVDSLVAAWVAGAITHEQLLFALSEMAR